MRHILVFSIFVVLFFNACGSKKYFSPSKIDGEIIIDKALKSEITNTNRSTAELKDGSLLTQKGIVINSKLSDNLVPKNAKFLNESGGYYIFELNCEKLFLIKTELLDSSFGSCEIGNLGQNNSCDKDSFEVELKYCPVNASVKENLLAVIGDDNSLELFDIKQEIKRVFTQKANSVIAVNQLIAAPLFLDTLVVFPTLDGKLLVVSTKNFQAQRSFLVGLEKFFNNVIFLEGDSSRIFAASNKKIISITNGQEFSKELEIMDLMLDDETKYLYAITLEGEILKLDGTLNIIDSKKFPYAKLEGLMISDNKLYSFEKKKGFIIELDVKTFDSKVYRAQDTFGKPLSNTLSFYTRHIFYYDRYYFDFRDFARRQ